MLIGVSFLSVMDACVKWLLIREISVIQIMAIRGWIITLCLLLLLPRRGGLKSLASKQKNLHLIRTGVGFFAPFLFFLSLKHLPIADATAIFFCTTFFMTAGSQIFLKETVGFHRWAAVVIGFLGVILISSPGTQSFHYASILALLAGAAYAVIILCGRVLSRAEPTFNLVFYFNGLNALIATALLPFFWGELNLPELGMIMLLSTLAIGGYFFLTQAFTLAPVSVIAPIEYISLIWAISLGYTIWQEVPSHLTWFGIGLILAAGLYILWRENRQAAPHTSLNSS